MTRSGMIDYNNGIYFISLIGYPTSPNSPLPTTFQSVLSVLTSLSHTPPHSYGFANSYYYKNALLSLVKFLYRACFSPFVDTWCKAIDTDLFTNWLGLTSSLVRKHLPKSIEAAKGYLILTHQHEWSTRTQPLPSPLLTPPSTPINQPIMAAGTLHTENPSPQNLVFMRLVEE